MWGNKEHYLGWNLEGRRIWQYKVFKAEEMTIHNFPWWHCTRKLFPALTFNKASLSLFLTHDPCSRHTVMFQLPSQCAPVVAGGGNDPRFIRQVCSQLSNQANQQSQYSTSGLILLCMSAWPTKTCLSPNLVYILRAKYISSRNVFS